MAHTTKLAKMSGLMPRIMLALFLLPSLGISPAVVRASANLQSSSSLTSENQSEVEELRERAMCGSTRRWRFQPLSHRTSAGWCKLDWAALTQRPFTCGVFAGYGSELGHRLPNGCLAPLRC